MRDKIRTIINAACRVYNLDASMVVTWRTGCAKQGAILEDYRRIVDPEHVALMQALCEAAEDVHESLEIGNRFFDAVLNLRQYREKEGLR